MSKISLLPQKSYRTKKNWSLSESEQIYLQELTKEVLSEISTIQLLQGGDKILDKIAMEYIRELMIIQLLAETQFHLDWALDYCLQYLRDISPSSIVLLDNWLTGKKTWMVRFIPSYFLVAILPKLSKDVQNHAKSVLTKKFPLRNQFFFHRRAFSSYFYTKLLPHRLFFVQWVGLWLARSKVKRKKSGLIESILVNNITPNLEIGDIIITRWNWNLTNATIPWFWKHMSIYVWDGYVCEAIGSQGIHKWKLSDLLIKNDYCLILRTRFSKEKKEQAICYVLKQIGKPYDFSFNYFSSYGAVCSALVTKAYLPKDNNAEGLTIELLWKWWAYTYPPNQLVMKMDQELDTNEEQIYPVIFIDASEKNKCSFISDLKTAQKTWQRSRWSFLQK